MYTNDMNKLFVININNLIDIQWPLSFRKMWNYYKIIYNIVFFYDKTCLFYFRESIKYYIWKIYYLGRNQLDSFFRVFLVFVVLRYFNLYLLFAFLLEISMSMIYIILADQKCNKTILYL